MIPFDNSVSEDTSVLPERPDFLPALMSVARFHGRGMAPDSLLRGLPLTDGILDAGHLSEAAARAELHVAALDKPPHKLSKTELPALVQREDGEAVALLRQDGDGFVMQAGAAPPGRMERAEAEALTGPVWCIRPAFFFDHRSLLFDLKAHKRWFAGPLFANRSLYGFAMLAGLFTNLASISVSIFVMTVYDRVVPNNALHSLTALLIGILMVIAMDFGMKAIRGYLVDAGGRRFDLTVGARLFARVLSMRPRGRPQSSGALANVVREFETVREFFTSATLVTLGDLPFVALYVFVIWWVAGAVVYVILIAIPVVIGAGLLLQWPLSRLVARGFREGSQKSAFLHEVAIGVDTIKAANAQAWARRQWEGYIVQNADTSLRSRQVSHLSLTITATASMLVTIGTVAVGALLIAAGEITTGAVIAATILAGRAMAPFGQIANLMARWQQTRMAISALDKIMVAETEEDQAGDQLQRFQIKGEIELSEVAFTYPATTMTGAVPEPALAKVSFGIPAGETVAVLGRIGSGKSTLLKLLVNLYGADSGHVKVDGVEVRQIHPAELRGQIGYAGQDAVLFHGSIRDNIALGAASPSDEDIVEAACVVGLDGMMAQSAGGLGTPVGERGQLLSGGQRQAVALARALVTRPAVLLLDEPTSMMDHTAEGRFLEALARSRRGLTTMIVTHKPSVLQLASRALVFERGKLVLDGPRDEVVAALSGGAKVMPSRSEPAEPGAMGAGP
ncbi:MAG: type I secretion system permease/ATPase [Alphaproteobacteria bacterium]|nr:type I secretion system permease/ATPase [Alphaproteobacteria bacterium]NKB56916.1 type I secretion system permease/ATPase [Alphaproteobacteria bacterium]